MDTISRWRLLRAWIDVLMAITCLFVAGYCGIASLLRWPLSIRLIWLAAGMAFVHAAGHPVFEDDDQHDA